MAVVTETSESREWSSGALTFRYRVAGTASETTALAELLDHSPTTHEGLIREDNPTLEPVWVDSVTGGGLWNCTVRYSPPQARELAIGSTVIHGDTTGGSQHVTQSIKTIGKYARPGKTAPEFHGAIGVTHDSIEGVDIIVPVFNFTVTKAFVHTAPPSLGNIYSLTGKVNSAAFTVTDTVTGVSLSFAAGEVLFGGASFGSVRGDGGIEFTYSFSASPNRTDIKIGDPEWEKVVTVASKKGWEYLWVRYADDTSAGWVVKWPVAAYVEKVYEEGNFAGLGL